MQHRQIRKRVNVTATKEVSGAKMMDDGKDILLSTMKRTGLPYLKEIGVLSKT